MTCKTMMVTKTEVNTLTMTATGDDHDVEGWLDGMAGLLLAGWLVGWHAGRDWVAGCTTSLPRVEPAY